VTVLEKAANHLSEKFQSPFHINGHAIYTSPSIGISISPCGGNNTKELLKSADVAMYLAKEEGKNKYKFFNPSLYERMSKKIEIETSLRRALNDGHFKLFYQPQVDLLTEEIVGVEALIRLNDPNLGMMSPADFTPVAEETGLIEPIGRWVIKTACYQMKEWQKKGWTSVSISVNVSIRQFQNPHFVTEVRNIIEETQLDPQFLKIEITESILSNINKTAKILNELRELGIQNRYR
jgi:predicted signal transduction protein with EAL and GGDEF domain